MTRATETDAGCWVDGHWGQYGIAHMIDKANDWGYPDKDLVALATAKLASIGPSTSEDITDEEEEILSESADEVESWLNDNVAPKGYSFGWHDGEFYLWSVADWEEFSY